MFRELNLEDLTLARGAAAQQPARADVVRAGATPKEVDGVLHSLGIDLVRPPDPAAMRTVPRVASPTAPAPHMPASPAAEPEDPLALLRPFTTRPTVPIHPGRPPVFRPVPSEPVVTAPAPSAPATPTGPTQIFDDGSTLSTFDDGSTLAMGTDASTSSSLAI